jgi:hypothetical protein
MQSPQNAPGSLRHIIGATHCTKLTCLKLLRAHMQGASVPCARASRHGASRCCACEWQNSRHKRTLMCAEKCISCVLNIGASAFPVRRCMLSFLADWQGQARMFAIETRGSFLRARYEGELTVYSKGSMMVLGVWRSKRSIRCKSAC